MSITTPSAEAIDSGEQVAFSPPKPFTDWGHEEHDTSIPTDEATLAMGNRTDFYPQSTETDSSDNPSSGAPTAKRRGLYHRIRKHNRDTWWAYRVDVNLSAKADHEMKLDMMDALGSQLEVGESLTWMGTRQIFRLDLTEVGLPTCAVGFCLYVHLYDEATSAYEARTPKRHWTNSPGTNRPYWPFRDSDANLPPFNRVAGNLISYYSNVTESSLQSVLQKLVQGGLPTREGGCRPTNTELLSK